VFPPTLNREQIKCSVIVAARDEEARIERTIRHLLAQRGVEFEIIVVDDRSRDRTSEILTRLAQEDARVQVKRVDVLPDGWLGKCHACHVGASAAAGNWILFTDADCWLKPDVLARALRVAERDSADHVTLVSGLALGSIGLRASHLLFLISLANWFSGVNRDRPKSHLGIGAFNLVRATAYCQCGGYEALRLTVVDDVKLGLLLRRAGKRTRAFLGGDDAECHWGATAWGMVKILEKNYFAAVDYRFGLVLAGSLFVIFLFCVLAFGLVSGTVAGLAAALSPLSLILPAGVLTRRLGWSWAGAACVPFIFPLFLYAVLNSTFVTLRQGGVRWRGTFYSLETLRAWNVR
jgi:glycosyltransferase involved in cell wall biosynthesis